MAATAERVSPKMLANLASASHAELQTTVQVLKEPDRANTTNSYVWVARGGPPETPVLVYRYEPSRAAAGGWRPMSSATRRRKDARRADRPMGAVQLWPERSTPSGPN